MVVYLSNYKTNFSNITRKKNQKRVVLAPDSTALVKKTLSSCVDGMLITCLLFLLTICEKVDAIANPWVSRSLSAEHKVIC